MALYRCHFLDRNDQMQAAEDIETEGLAEAIGRALAMLDHRPQHQSVEIWQGARKVYPIEASAA